MARHELGDPLIGVLVHEQHAEAIVRLPLERPEQRLELRSAVDGRDDEIEGRKLRGGHAPYASAVKTAGTPLVSVLLAVHDDAHFASTAIESILRQTLTELELVVIDDASSDSTPQLLADLSDPRVVTLRNDEQLGLAGSLNRGLEHARGRYVARLDADDVALPDRLERQLARIEGEPGVAIVGTAVVDLGASSRPSRVHRLPGGARAVRWHALFGAPFFHPTVLVSRALLDDHGLRYERAYLESEDYDLWTRLLAFADGDNLADPLVLKRVHPGQATIRRGGLQSRFQREIALRQIAHVAPELAPADAELAWRLGSGAALSGSDMSRAADALIALLAAFERRHGADRAVRTAAARRLARVGLVRRALRLAPDLPLRIAADRATRPVREHATRRRAGAWLASFAGTVPSQGQSLRGDSPSRGQSPGPGSEPVRVTVVSPEPTPYRSPLFDRIAERSDLALTVVYASSTVARRTWSVEPRHRAVLLRGARVPGLRRIVRHDYPLTPGIGRALRESQPQVVVVSGWSTFAAQVAPTWCRAHGIPYVLLVESHDLGPRAKWRRLVKSAVVPRIVRGAASVLVVGALARESVVGRGAAEERVRVFANTIDVDAWVDRAEDLAERRTEFRSALGAGSDDVLVLSVARLAPEKGHDQLVRAVAQARDPRLLLVLAGTGPEDRSLTRLAQNLGVRLVLAGDLSAERVAEAYVAADAFALLSSHEPWGVAVNEAAASALPLVLSDRVGAARDLLRDSENGYLVPAGDVDAAAAALARLAGDQALRREAGARSLAIVREWGYEPSAESFVAAVREAAER